MGEGEGEMKPARPKRAKGTWYVSCESKERIGKRAHARMTKTFPNERDAKTFAKTKLAEGMNVNAGTLNPHQPKRTLTSPQLLDWLNEPDL
jgi:hypothetical protein